MGNKVFEEYKNIEILAMSIINHTNEVNGVSVKVRQENNDKCFDFAVDRIMDFLLDRAGVKRIIE